MTDVQLLVERYIDVWNQTDPVRRREVIDDIYEPNATYVDPLAVAEGVAAIDATIGAVQQQFGGLTFRLVGGVDTHHNLVRFTWELGPPDEALVVGFDVAVLSASGRFEAVHGFLDKVPA